MKNKKIFTNFEMIFLVCIASIVSLLIGYGLSFNVKKDLHEYDDNLNEFIFAYDNIKKNYYEKIDTKELLNGAVKGMLSTLDEHSLLIDQEENENFYLTLEGAYDGIGVEIVEADGKIVIVGIIPNSPASEAGLKAGDIVKKVDDIELDGKDTKTLSNYIRKDSSKNEFNLIIDRDGEEIEFKLKKQNVVITSVISKIIEKNDKKIGYMYISIFSNTTASQFNSKLTELIDEGIDGLIIDVRDNTGGHLSTAVSILSQLMAEDKVIYKINKNGKVATYNSMGNKDIIYPIAVIQNSNSASAAELLSSSLRDNLDATIVGNISYGKGTVQEYNYLTNGNMYKYTTKKWLTPNGDSIDGVGVEPDIDVTLIQAYYNDPTDDNDNQLQAALDEIIKKIK